MSEKLEELISLLYQDKLTQYGKRLLVENIEKLEKENEELKNDYENLNNSVVVKNHCIKNSIPVKKIKDKIEELNKKEKKELKGMKGQDRYFVKQTYQNKRMILQELLKESEE